MKLTATQVEQTLTAVPSASDTGNPSGDVGTSRGCSANTSFFLDGQGLSIVETAKADGDANQLNGPRHQPCKLGGF